MLRERESKDKLVALEKSSELGNKLRNSAREITDLKNNLDKNKKQVLQLQDKFNDLEKQNVLINEELAAVKKNELALKQDLDKMNNDQSVQQVKAEGLIKELHEMKQKLKTLVEENDRLSHGEFAHIVI